jgi:signal transduction histidine kinase
MATFFTHNIIGVYFFYGLAFFCMGLAIWLEVSHASELDFSRALRPLAAFGLLHGSHEWFEMWLLIEAQALGYKLEAAWIDVTRLLLLAISFLMLVLFGAGMITTHSRPRAKLGALLAIITLWVVGLVWVIQTQVPGRTQIVAADVYTRYALAIPGAALTAWGLLGQRRKFNQLGMQSFGRDVTLAAIAFALYGGIGQLFASPSVIFPSEYINADVFIRWFGFPIQVFRALMACMAAIFIIRSMRSFEVENRRQIETLRESQLAERQRLESLRGELFHRTVKAQEAERQRIARELHDETGQTFTALGMGLRGLAETITANPNKATQQAKTLETLATAGIQELQNLVTGLHPPQLDDFGLLAALRWYAEQVSTRFGLPVSITSQGPEVDMPTEVRVVLFRIAQEAITNVVRHSQATQATLHLEYQSNQVKMQVEDNGRGFDVEKTLQANAEHPCWGLLGIMERAALAGGACQLTSTPGKGTCVGVTVKLA